MEWNGEPSFVVAIINTKIQTAFVMSTIPCDERPIVDSNSVFSIRQIECVPQRQLDLLSVLGKLLRHDGTKKDVQFQARDGCRMSVNFEVTDSARAILSVTEGADIGAITIFQLRSVKNKQWRKVFQKRHDPTKGFGIVHESGAHVLRGSSQFVRAGSARPYPHGSWTTNSGVHRTREWHGFFCRIPFPRDSAVDPVVRRGPGSFALAFRTRRKRRVPWVSDRERMPNPTRPLLHVDFGEVAPPTLGVRVSLRVRGSSGQGWEASSSLRRTRPAAHEPCHLRGPWPGCVAKQAQRSAAM